MGKTLITTEMEICSIDTQTATKRMAATKIRVEREMQKLLFIVLDVYTLFPALSCTILIKTANPLVTSFSARLPLSSQRGG